MSSCIDRVIGESDSCLPVIGIPCLPVTDLTFLSRLARDPSFLTSLLTDRVNGRALARTHLAHTWNPCPSKRMSRLFLRSRCASLEPAHPKPPSFYPQAVLYPNSQAPFTLVTPPGIFPLAAFRLLLVASLLACSLAVAVRFAHSVLPPHSLRSCMYAYVPNAPTPHHIGNVPLSQAHQANVRIPVTSPSVATTTKALRLPGLCPSTFRADSRSATYCPLFAWVFPYCSQLSSRYLRY